MHAFYKKWIKAFSKPADDFLAADTDNNALNREQKNFGFFLFTAIAKTIEPQIDDQTTLSQFLYLIAYKHGKTKK